MALGITNTKKNMAETLRISLLEAEGNGAIPYTGNLIYINNQTEHAAKDPVVVEELAKVGKEKGGVERGFLRDIAGFEEEGVAVVGNVWRHWKEGKKLGGGAHQGQSDWSKTTGATDFFKEAPDLKQQHGSLALKQTKSKLPTKNKASIPLNWVQSEAPPITTVTTALKQLNKVQLQSNPTSVATNHSPKRLIRKGSAGNWLWNNEMEFGDYYSLRKKSSTSSSKRPISRFSGWATDGPPGHHSPSKEQMPVKLLKKFQDLQGYRWQLISPGALLKSRIPGLMCRRKLYFEAEFLASIEQASGALFCGLPEAEVVVVIQLDLRDF
ncbi:hypothetical protein PPACK8108_LOCUS9965 [Phakopsora pachyrhizi]|uniref:Uncharacterized protein n=1 Tax=Phakopsora pachyrhizi TaxID=170000 RepID=A0AAV0B0C8_PHAPC|nr:hypothetical protein PPACK8108_LOCUS9965 [Phakopsora pachyrhizi]